MTKILLVEDDKSLREIYGVRLLAEGYDIVSAGDGEEALAMAIKERPQLIVSDVMMPKISGFDMLDILRSTTETKDIKVIMMTALSSEDQRARGEALGADRYLVKSQVGIEDVVRTIHEVLGDAPVTGGAASFQTPPAGRPATPTIPPRQPVDTSAQPTAPQAAVPPAPVPATSSQPIAAAPAPRAPVPPSNSHGGEMPQPTAPFSTARPAGLGERIIHPITPNDTKPDIGSLMDQELNQAATPAPVAPTPASAPATPIAPPPPPPTPVSPMGAVDMGPPQAQVTAAEPTAPTSPQPSSPPPSAPQPQAQNDDSDIEFEETPRQAPSAPGGPQPS